MKTRAFDPIEKRWRTDYVVMPDGTLRQLTYNKNYAAVLGGSVNWKLSRFAGLLDKNGKEIYEGDIVKAWLCFGPAGEDLRVYQVKITSHGTNIQGWTFNESKTFWPEVIGNVFQNPELLEVK